ncbi:hypothetical protein Cs7R123_46800 [Catellatospora sp. TT07R-123]|uniref:hypothetical protein n=1 Tax=Catellatospora sp. TT07R-123 TaxID=2733863 RepID=UPI001B095756|nr:hypothetical protein [Catellatospora sp. TT07R-123]GHJ47338.1 hypothetical protein Cs7R123_46800 [Catellatospora sp. TT07R-123]
MTGVGGGQDGDAGEVNLEWYIDPDDDEIGVMQTFLDNGGYAGTPMSTFLSVICVSKT